MAVIADAAATPSNAQMRRFSSGSAEVNFGYRSAGMSLQSSNQSSQQLHKEQQQQQQEQAQQPQQVQHMVFDSAWTRELAAELTSHLLPTILYHLNEFLGGCAVDSEGHPYRDSLDNSEEKPCPEEHTRGIRHQTTMVDLRALPVAKESGSRRVSSGSRSDDGDPPSCGGAPKNEQALSESERIRHKARGPRSIHELEAALASQLEEEYFSTHSMDPQKHVSRNFDRKASVDWQDGSSGTGIDVEICHPVVGIHDPEENILPGLAEQHDACEASNQEACTSDQFPYRSDVSGASPLWGSTMVRNPGRKGTENSLNSVPNSLKQILPGPKGTSVHRMRFLRDEQLTSSMDIGSWDRDSPAPTSQAASGPCERFCRKDMWRARLAMLLITVLALLSCGVEKPGFAKHSMMDKLEVVGDFILRLGALGGLLGLRRLPSSAFLDGQDTFLIKYALRQGVMKNWKDASTITSRCFIAVWLSSAASRGAGLWLSGKGPEWGAFGLPWFSRDLLGLVAHLWCLGVALAVVYSIIHMCSVLTFLVDAFVVCTSEFSSLSEGEMEWNILQALLRKVASAVELSFLVMKTTMFLYVIIAALMLIIGGPSVGWLFFGAVLLAVCSVRMFFSAAQVTERVMRVPPYLNSMSCGERHVDNSRHRLVEYITYSRAGFYIFEVRLTGAMALKLSYISGMVAFGIITNLATSF